MGKVFRIVRRVSTEAEIIVQAESKEQAEVLIDELYGLGAVRSMLADLTSDEYSEEDSVEEVDEQDIDVDFRISGTVVFDADSKSIGRLVPKGASWIGQDRES